ncbi:MAG: glutamate formimidoyltransferase [Bryobacteraceae bacterium]
MIECVPNVSEGRNLAVIDAIVAEITAVPGVLLLHRTSDPDHNRSVITFAGPEEAVLEAAVRAAIKSAETIDLTRHKGIHPRLGSLDVLPFVPLGDTPLSNCIDIAHRAGERIWLEAGVPVYFYEAAARQPGRIRLEDVRRGQFEGLREAVVLDETRQPDLGGPTLHPTAGAVIVGARKLLVAFNINLHTTDLSIAKDIARAMRTSSGGFPAVKALGFPLPSRGQVQVSMNLTDFDQTPVHVAYQAVARLAAERGVEVAHSELIGLIPRRALEQAAAGLLKLTGFDSQRVIEARLETLQRKPPHLH